MFHRVGHAFVHDIRLGVGPLSFRMGLDAYVDGRGLMKIGPSVRRGVEFDQGALIALWGEALGFPSAWEGRDDVRWEPVDDVTALLIVAGPEGDIPITVGFDPATGYPAFCEADRYKATGPKVRWRGTSSDWRRFPGGVLSPSRYSAAWNDRHTHRGVVPGRDAGGSEEQAHLSLGHKGLACPRRGYAANARNRPMCSVRSAPELGTGAALVLPACNTEAMQLHLNEIATKVTLGAHAILILDQAGWHGAKDLQSSRQHLRSCRCPPRSPELNPQENIWQFMRANWLSNRVFEILRRHRRSCCTPGTRSSTSPGK